MAMGVSFANSAWYSPIQLSAELQGSSHLSLRSVRVTGTRRCTWLFTQVLGIQNRVLVFMCVTKHFTH